MEACRVIVMQADVFHNSMSISALFKRFALIYLPSMAVFSIVLLLGIRHHEQDRVGQMATHEQYLVEVARERMIQDFESAEAVLRIIAQMGDLRQYLDSGNPEKRHELEQFFLTVAREAQHYDQIRYLDASGEEVIRVDYHDGKPAVVPHDQLQSKAKRYYFRDTIKLKQNEIYTSPLDLNIEHGQLEIPYKPMIRFGTPVFDSAGHKQGVVLLNYCAGELRQHFQMLMSESHVPGGMLLNREGYWLSSPHPEDEWGFMLGKPERTFSHDYPEVWRTILVDDAGTVLTDQGLFSYITVHPISGDDEYQWKIVSFLPQAVLSAGAFYNKASGRILIGSVYLLLALIALFIAFIILKLKQAETKRQESEAQIRQITMSAQDAIVMMGPDQCITFWNSAAEKIFGYTASEAVGQKLHPMIASEDAQQPFKQGFQHFLLTGTGPIIGKINELTALRKGGEAFPVEVSLAATSISGEWHAIGIFRDISELKQKSAAMRESEEKFHSIFEGSSDGIVLADVETKQLAVGNSALCQMLGYSPGELTQLGVSDIHPQQDLPHVIEQFEKQLRGEIQLAENIPVKRKDGSILYADIKSTHINIGGKNYLLGMFRDITERKGMEHALHEIEARLAISLAGAELGTWDWNLQTDRVDFNARWAEMRGYRMDEIEPHVSSWKKGLSPDDLPDIQKKLTEHFEGRTPLFDAEYRVLNKTGQWIWILDRGTVIERDADGKPLRMTGVEMDIAQRKQSEQALRNNLAEKEVLMREIHHRVKNNMQVISSLLSLQAGYTSNEEAHALFKDLEMRIRSMALVHEKLYRSTDLREIDFGEYLPDLLNSILIQYPDRQGHLSVSIDVVDVILPVDKAVPCGLILSELLTNIFKHAFPDQQQGEISIAMHRQKDGMISLQVADNGVGIHVNLDEQAEKTFGLSILKMLVEHQLGGTVNMDGTKGTVFTITFKEHTDD